MGGHTHPSVQPKQCCPWSRRASWLAAMIRIGFTSLNNPLMEHLITMSPVSGNSLLRHRITGVLVVQWMALTVLFVLLTQLSGFNENRIGLFRFVPMVEDAISMTTKKNASSVSLQYAPIALIRSSTSETIRNKASRKEMSLISSQHAWNRSPKLR